MQAGDIEGSFLSSPRILLPFHSVTSTHIHWFESWGVAKGAFNWMSSPGARPLANARNAGMALARLLAASSASSCLIRLIGEVIDRRLWMRQFSCELAFSTRQIWPFTFMVRKSGGAS